MVGFLFLVRRQNMKKRTIFIIIAIILVILIGIFAVMQLLGPAVQNVYSNIMDDAAETGEDFLGALKDANYQQAFSLCSTALKQEVGNASNLETMFMAVKPLDTWEYELQTAESETGESAVGLIGEITYYDGSIADFQMFIVFEDGTPKVAAFEFKPS
jgi:hypothetical protein